MRKITSILLALTILVSSLISTSYADTVKKTGLKDIKGYWAEKEIQSLYSKKIVSGLPDGTFNPLGNVSRGEYIKMLVTALGYETEKNTTSFKDLNYENYWAKKYIEAAVREGIIIPSEIGDEFWGTANITRYDMMVMTAKALKLKPSTKGSEFVDLDSSMKDAGYIIKLKEEYIAKGKWTKEGSLAIYPDELVTRAEGATLIARMLEYKENRAKYIEKAKYNETNSKGIPLRLFEYKATMGAPFELDRKEYVDELEELEEAESKEKIEEVLEYVKDDLNIDYTKLDKNKYIDKMMKNHQFGYYKPEATYNCLKKYKVKIQAEFKTDRELVTLLRVRGTMRVKFDKNTAQEYINMCWSSREMHPGHTYEIDVDFILSQNQEGIWHVGNNYWFAPVGKPVLIE